MTYSQLEAENAALRRRIADLEALLPERTAEMRAPIERGDDEWFNRLLAEHTSDVVWILDLSTWRIVYISPSVQILCGYTPAEILEKPLEEIMSPDSVEQLRAQLPARIAAFFAGEHVAARQTTEVVQRCKDGSTVWSEVTTKPLMRPDGSLQLLGVSRDITKRKAAEAALLKRERELKRAQAVAHTGSWVLDTNTERLEWSEETYRIFGVPDGSVVLDSDFLALVHPEDKHSVEEAWARALHSGLYLVDHRIVVDGNTKWVREQAEFEFDEDGRLAYGVGTVQDITRQRYAEEALRRSEQKYRVIFEGAKEGIVAVDLHQQRFAFVNQAMCALFGYTEEEFLCITFPKLHPADAIARVIAEFAMMARGERTEVSTVPCLHKDGTRFYVDIKAAVATIGDEQLMIGFFHDVTDRYRGDLLLRSRLRLSTLPPDCLLDELLRATLDEAECVTESEIGFFHFVDEDADTVLLQNWSTNTVTQNCTVDARGHRSSIAKAGIWAECVRTRRPMICNDYPAYEHRSELPEGHLPLTRMIAIPVHRDGRVVALIGVGGKATDYDAHDVDAISILAAETWDIVLRKRAEAAQRESEERYRILVENIESTIATVDASGVHHYINAFGARALRRSIEDIVGKSMHDLFASDSADHMVANIRQVIASGQRIVEEAPFRSEEGVRWYRTTILPLRNTEGQALQALLNSVDITESKTAELLLEARVRQRTAELESIRQRLELATGAANIGIWEWNYKTDELIWDDQMLSLYGLTRDTFDGRRQSWEQCVVPEDLASQAMLAEAAGRGDSELESEFRVRLPDGTVRHLKASAIALPDEFGHAERVIGVNYDITLNKRAEQTLRESEDALRRANLELARAVRMKDDFLASMSHELRTPLAGILGMTEVLLYTKTGPLNEKQSRAVNAIESSGRHLLDLINDILDISKIDADKLQLQISRASLDELCQASIQLVKGLAQRKSQNVCLTMDRKGVMFECDVRRVKQILVNLLSNAIKFTPDSRSIGLDVVSDDAAGEVRITVWDEGIGIHADDLPKVFQPFFQLDSSISRQQGGSGLGLALVARLVALHGGGISVESQPGGGSRFTVVLPWKPSPHDTRSPSAQSTAVGTASMLHAGEKSVTVLPRRRTALAEEDSGKDAGTLTGPLVMIVDDSHITGEPLTEYLESNNYRVSSAASGLEFLVRLPDVRPDVILMDIQMPGMDGVEAIRRLRAYPDHSLASTPVIALTALAMAGDRERCLAAGANEYMSKPMSLAKLCDMIDQIAATPPATPG